jgi:HemY protein
LFDRETGTPPMIRILVYFAVVFAVAVGAAWLADRPGTVTVDWQGWRLDTSVMVAVVALLALLAATIVVWAVLRGIFRAPWLFRRYLGRRRENKGHAALSRGLVAVGAGDARLARRYMTEARRLLPHDPATRFLEAQTAQLTGDGAAARAAFQAMLEDPETRALGLHGLYVEAVRAGEPAAAYHYAEEAAALAPALPWAGRARFEHAAAVRDWEGAIAILDKNAHNGLVDKPAAKRLKAVLLTARALELEAAAPERARALALEAHGLAGDLVPAAAVAGRVLARLGDPRRAGKVIEATWRRAPHPELAEAYALVRPGETGRDRLKRMRALAALKPGDAEGRLAVARAAIDARDFAAAREELRAVLAERPSQRACLLMADLEEAEHGDRGRVREWLARAVRAPRDPVWTADGVTSEHWAPVSPATGRLDAFEWKVPVEAIGSSGGPLVDEALFAPPEPEAPPPVTLPAAAAPPAAALATPSPRPSGAATAPAAAGSGSRPADGQGAATPAGGSDTATKPFWAREYTGGATAGSPPATPSASAPVAPAGVEATATPVAPAGAPVVAASPAKASPPTAAPGSGASALAGSSGDATAKEVLVMPSSPDGAPPGASGKPYWARDREAAALAPADPRQGPKLVEFPLAHSPDDPGPASAEEEAPEPRRRLF